MPYYIVTVAPLRIMPRPAEQFLSYLAAEKITPGALVEAPLRKKAVLAAVFDCREADKQEVKKAGFSFKHISKTVSAAPVFEKWQLKLAWWLSEYYFSSPGVFLKAMLPAGGLAKKDLLQIALMKKSPRPKKPQTLFLVPTLGELLSLPKEAGRVLFHSGLKTSEQKEIWRGIKSGTIKKAAGTRAAAFLPFSGSVKITVSRESNPHHRSWDMFPRWRVHEVAQKTVQFKKSGQVIFQSALPTVESFYWAKKKQLALEHQFPRENPEFKIIDSRREIAEKNYSVFSRSLQGAVENHLKKKRPVLLFNLRRGAATFILCRDCGYTALCPNCEVSLVKHFISFPLREELWLCHHCGYSQAPNRKCPECGLDKIKEFGIGSQKVEAAARSLWPWARVARLDSDSAPDPGRQKEIVKKFNAGRIDLLIATPVVFSHRLKKVHLAGVISADTILNLPDFRSGERLFKIIGQIRSLCAGKDSFVLIQTFNPEERTLKLAAKGRFEKFYQEELQTRKILDYPPFCQIIKLTSKHKNPKEASNLLRENSLKLERVIREKKLGEHFQLFGPLPAFIPREKGRYVYNLIIKFKPVQKDKFPLANEDISLRNELLKFISPKVFVDVDPESIL